jgi:hypothetical protein
MRWIVLDVMRDLAAESCARVLLPAWGSLVRLRDAVSLLAGEVLGVQLLWVAVTFLRCIGIGRLLAVVVGSYRVDSAQAVAFGERVGRLIGLFVELLLSAAHDLYDGLFQRDTRYSNSVT